MLAFLPNLSIVSCLQLTRFLIFFFLVGIELAYGLLGFTFHITSAAILVMAIFTISYPDKAILFFMFFQFISYVEQHGYSLLISIILDIVAVLFNWGLTEYKTWRFYFILVVAFLMLFYKIYYALAQIQKGKELNNEPSLPIDVDNLFNISTNNANHSSIDRGYSNKRSDNRCNRNYWNYRDNWNYWSCKYSINEIFAFPQKKISQNGMSL
ncbi:hypothetical protein BpHYR1_021915 [Brachionus plicatilis]|uniref:Uncharacterized protein n=1 Tax=Brachionus plicatilis TaxID=10195 RepID=A0A3M7PLA2_BRAPC|nr:hypothetical protein BpHYR1_021915 [Brachionus plicatilis]